MATGIAEAAPGIAEAAPAAQVDIPVVPLRETGRLSAATPVRAPPPPLTLHRVAEGQAFTGALTKELFGKPCCCSLHVACCS